MPGSPKSKAGSNSRIVKFSMTDSPVTIEITSGFVTLGSFVLAYRRKGTWNFQEFGKEPKKIDDDLPDIFVIPIPLDELAGIEVLILGKYRPAPGHIQVKVDYHFVQGTKELLKVSVQDNVSTSEVFKNYKHRFSFREAS